MAAGEKLNRAEEEAAYRKYPTKGVALGAAIGGLAGGGYGALTPPHLALRGTRAAALGTLGALSGASMGFAATRAHQRERIKQAIRDSGSKKEASLARSMLVGGGTGALLGGAGAGIDALSDWSRSVNQGVSRPEDTRNRFKHVGVGAAIGGLGGAVTGALFHRAVTPQVVSHKVHARAMGFDPSSVKTKKQAQNAYRAAARKYHPDVNPGGTEKMKDINKAWEGMKNTPWYNGLKEASYPPFLAFLRAVYAGQ